MKTTLFSRLNFKNNENMVRLLLIIVPIFLFGCVDELYYHPDRIVYQTPDKHGLKYENVRFNSNDGTRLSGWFIHSTTRALGTVIHFHGNAQNMSSHFSFVSWLPKNGFNVFVFDYRGYGMSQGKPNREGVHQDSVTALEYLLTRPDINRNKIIVIGQSLGGANAISVMGRGHAAGIRGIVIESAFASYSEIAKDVIKQSLLSTVSSPLISIAVSDKYSPVDVVANISPTPILFIHGTADRTVPYKHVMELYEKAKEPKQLWTIKNGGHTEAFTKYRKDVLPKLYQTMRKWVE